MMVIAEYSLKPQLILQLCAFCLHASGPAARLRTRVTTTMRRR